MQRYTFLQTVRSLFSMSSFTVITTSPFGAEKVNQPIGILYSDIQMTSKLYVCAYACDSYYSASVYCF